MKLTFLIYCLTVFTLSFAQNESDKNLKTWASNAPLTWSDFTGEVDRSSSFDAWTYAGVNYVYSWYYNDDNNIEIDINAWAYFDHLQSWVKKNATSIELLAHEQLHFDIAELHCRYFLQAAVEFNYSGNVDAEIDSIYNVYYEKMLATQIEYDLATDHFNNSEEQKKWIDFIHQELERLAAFDYK